MTLDIFLQQAVLRRGSQSRLMVLTQGNGHIGDVPEGETFGHSYVDGFVSLADVLCQEPPAADNPLLALDNCYFTPHIGWTSPEARQRLMDVVVNNVKTFIEGNPTNIVNR